MTFINQYILFGLAAVVIPIIIHLFNRRKAKVIDWGAMQFLLGSLVNRKRRILVEELILMTLRCLLLAVLVLAVARPFAPVNSGASWLVLLPLLLAAAVLMAVAAIVARRRAWRWLLYLSAIGLVAGVAYLSQNQQLLQAARWKSSTEQDVAIVIDGSSSMRVLVDGKSNFQRGVQEARRLVESLGPEDTISVVVAGAIARTATAQPLSVRGEVEDMLAALQPVGGELSVIDGLSAAASALAAGPHAVKKIVLISDGQDIGWQADNRGQWEFVADTLNHLPTRPKVVARFLPLPDNFQNAAISTIELSRELVGTDREVTIQVRVQNTGFETIELSGVQLQFDGDKVMSADVGTIEPGESAQSNFQHRFTDSGLHRIDARLLLNDDLAEDNLQSRIVQVLDTLPVLLVDGSAQVRAADQATSFIEIALAPPAADDVSAGDAAGAAGRLVAATVVAAPDVNDGTPFADYRVVMLVDVPRLGAATAEKLAEFVQQGGGLLVAPGSRCQAEFYNQWKLPDGQPVLPAALVERILIEQGGQTTRPVEASFRHPALTRLVSAGTTDISQAVISAYWQLAPLPGDADAVVGGRLDGGDPLLVQHVLGRGAVAVAAVSLDGGGSNLPSLVSFLPLMHELTYNLAAPNLLRLNRQPAGVLAVELPIADLPSAPAGDGGPSSEAGQSVPAQSVTVLLPGGEARTARVETRGGRAVLTLSDAVAPGVYRVELDGELAQRCSAAVTDTEGQAYLPLTVLYPEAESRLAPLSEQQEAAAARHLDYFRAANSEQMVAAVIGDVPGHELWKYLAIIAVVVVLAESFVARWIAQQRKIGSTETVAFISEGERLSTFQERARQLVESVRN